MEVNNCNILYQGSEDDPTQNLNNYNNYNNNPLQVQNNPESDATLQHFEYNISQQYGGYGQQTNFQAYQQQGQYYGNQLYPCNNQEQQNYHFHDLYTTILNQEISVGYLAHSQEQISQSQISQYDMSLLGQEQQQENVQEDLEHQSEQNQLNQSHYEEIPETEDKQDSSASQKSVKSPEGKKEKRKRRITKVKHNLDGKYVDKLKNFYRNLMSRIQGALSPMYQHNKDMLKLIKFFCFQSNQRNFLKIFPQMNEGNYTNEDDEDIEEVFKNQGNKSYQRQLLLELRERANAIFGNNFHKMVCLYKSNNSFKNKEEFFYGCLFYAERAAKKSPFMSSERSPVNGEPNQVFRFNFENTVFPETQYISNGHEISNPTEQNFQESYNPSMFPQYSQEPDSLQCSQGPDSPQCSQEPVSPALYHHF